MTDKQIDDLLEAVERLVIEHVEGYIFVAEVKRDNGKTCTIKNGTDSNAMAIGLADLLIHDVHYARDEIYEKEKSDE